MVQPNFSGDKALGFTSLIVRQFRLDDSELTDYIRAGIIRTFDQDKAVLEAQQRAIGPDPDNVAFPVSIRVDAGPMQGRKLLNAMIAREATASGSLSRQASR
jgi:vanillate O-demethylase monooxygenase subunit